jgi:WD40 repeat protein
VAWPGKLVRWAARRPALAAALALTFLAITATAIVATISAVRIDEARDRALSAAVSEKRQADEARRHAVRLHIAEANRRQADGDLIGSLPQLVAALRAEMDDPDRRSEHTTRLAATLRQCPRLVHHWSLASWHDRRDRTLMYPGRVYAADFSPDGKWIACATGEKHLHLWNTETGADEGAAFAEDGAVYVKFSADGKRLLTGTTRDTISLWDFEKRTPLFRDVKHALAGSHPSSLLPPVMDRTASRIVRVEPGEGLLAGAYVILPDAPRAGDAPLQIPLHLKPAVRSLAISPDESRFAVGRADGTVMLHQAGTWLPIGRAFGVSGAVRGMAFNPDNSRLAVLSGTNSVKLYALDSESISKLEQTMTHSGFAYGLAWSPEGTRVASAAYGERASFLMRGEDGVADAVVRQSPGIFSAEFSPDGATLLTAGFDNAARLFDPRTGAPAGPPLHHAGYVSTALYSPDGRYIFTGAYDATARLWELPVPPTAPQDVANSKASAGARILGRRDHKEGLFGPITVHKMADASELGRTAPGQCAGLTEDGRVLLYMEGDRFELLKLNGSASATTLSRFTFPYSKSAAGAREAEISPDGRRALISPDRRAIHLFDLTVAEANQVTVIKLDARFTRLSFSLDGSMVAVSTARPQREAGSAVSLWNLADGKQITAFTTGQAISHLEFSPDSRLIAWGGALGSLRAGAARIHRCTDGVPVTPFLMHRGNVTDMEFRPDGRLLATSSTDGFVRLWNGETGALAAPELPHPNSVAHVSFSRDGRRLVSLVPTGAAAMRVWDPVSGEAMSPPLRLTKGAWMCRFTDDGTALITAGTTFVRWPLTVENRTPADLIEEAELLSAHRQDDVTGQRPVPPAELRATFERRKRRE